jgi:hypothetical protein
MATMAMRQFSVTTPTNSLSSWSVPRSPPVLGLGQLRLARRKLGLWGDLGLKAAEGRRRQRLRSFKRGAPQATFISPPADPQFLRLDQDGMEEVLGSVPVAPRGPKPIITWSLVAGLLWKQKLRLTVAAMALVAATTCTLTMPLFSGPK